MHQNFIISYRDVAFSLLFMCLYLSHISSGLCISHHSVGSSWLLGKRQKDRKRENGWGVRWERKWKLWLPILYLCNNVVTITHIRCIILHKMCDCTWLRTRFLFKLLLTRAKLAGMILVCSVWLPGCFCVFSKIFEVLCVCLGCSGWFLGH